MVRAAEEEGGQAVEVMATLAVGLMEAAVEAVVATAAVAVAAAPTAQRRPRRYMPSPKGSHRHRHGSVQCQGT